LLFSCNSENYLIKVTNDLNINRSFETVELDLNLFPQKIINNISEYGIFDLKNNLLLSQIIDNNLDGKNDIIIFQPQIDSNSSVNFLFKKKNKSNIKKDKNICYSNLITKRMDDFAWENDRVAFRTYGPEAQRLILNNKKGGIISSGIDCWLKRVEYPIIEKWYAQHFEKISSYHEDIGEGLDNYHVGKSRGAGGFSILIDKEYYNSRNFIKSRIISNGPLRTIFELEYEDWNIPKGNIEEKKIISLDKGNNLCKIAVQIKGTKSISPGIFLNEFDGKISENLKNSWVSYWQPHYDSELGNALLSKNKYIIGSHKYLGKGLDKNHLYLDLKVVDNYVEYYTGFTWLKSNQFNDKESWNSYLDNFSMKLNNPLKIEIIL
tara:strand:+ start:2237 stop:3370 length:1134 start_codon:yes stop_codon:yes gene_type:complete